MKFGLHPRYPLVRPHQGLRCTAVQRRVFRHCSLLPFSIPLPPFPMCRAPPARSTTATPPRPGPISRRWAQPAASLPSMVTDRGRTQRPVLVVVRLGGFRVLLEPSVCERPDHAPLLQPPGAQAGHLPCHIGSSLFCHPLPKGLRALFVAIWDPGVKVTFGELLEHRPAARPVREHPCCSGCRAPCCAASQSACFTCGLTLRLFVLRCPAGPPVDWGASLSAAAGRAQHPSAGG